MIEVDSKTFKSGNSVALRLPRELGIAEGMVFTIRKVGETIRIEPKRNDRLTPAQLVAALRASGPPPGPRVGREKILFPKRRGL
ncbi:MAG: AbrB/MazE/SpoVT family DNA-binding domain-containing protein [Sphingomicrobium sp.]